MKVKAGGVAPNELPPLPDAEAERVEAAKTLRLIAYIIALSSAGGMLAAVTGYALFAGFGFGMLVGGLSYIVITRGSA